MKKFKNHNKHQRRFIGLATFIFLVIGIVHTVRILFNWDLSVGGFTLTPTIDVLGAFIALCMAAMGVYYFFAKE